MFELAYYPVLAHSQWKQFSSGHVQGKQELPGMDVAVES